MSSGPAYTTAWRALVQLDLNLGRQARAKAAEVGLARIKLDTHGDVLDNLGEIAGARLERQQAKLRARAGRQALDLTGEFAAGQGV